VQVPERNYFLIAANDAERNEWVAAIGPCRAAPLHGPRARLARRGRRALPPTPTPDDPSLAIVAGRATTESRRVRSYSEEVRRPKSLIRRQRPHPPGTASVSASFALARPVQVEYQEQQARLAKAKKQAAQAAEGPSDAQEGEGEDVVPVQRARSFSTRVVAPQDPALRARIPHAVRVPPPHRAPNPCVATQKRGGTRFV
tara:strand:- start:4768 stop:5367 length:600 start_codon:yes stop_codon:yes gene_type:complete